MITITYELNNFESLQIRAGVNREDSRMVSTERLPNPKLSTTELLSLKKTVCSAKGFSDRQRTGSVTAENTRESDIKASYVTSCGVEVTKAKVRRERMGTYQTGRSGISYLVFQRNSVKNGACPGHFPENIWKRYFTSLAYIVTDPGDTDFGIQRNTDRDSSTERQRISTGNRFKAAMGAEAVKELAGPDRSGSLYPKNCREKLKGATGQKKIRIVRRLEVIEALRDCPATDLNG